jgi:CRP-like cAMP-binding protein
MSNSKEQIREKLKQIPIFHDLKDDLARLRLLEGICRMKRCNKGTVMIEEGDIGNEMYIVYSGAVEIKKRTRAGDDYTVLKLSAAQNVFFGEIALIDDDRRSATVIATEDSEFLVITKQSFQKLGNDHPEIGLPITREIAKILASRLRKTTGDMLILFDALVNEIRE